MLQKTKDAAKQPNLNTIKPGVDNFTCTWKHGNYCRWIFGLVVLKVCAALVSANTRNHKLSAKLQTGGGHPYF